MDSSLTGQLLEKGGFFFILVLVLYYFLSIYIPRKDEAYEKRIDGMMNSFKESMTHLTSTLDKRLFEIEKVIQKNDE